MCSANAREELVMIILLCETGVCGVITKARVIWSWVEAYKRFTRPNQARLGFLGKVGRSDRTHDRTPQCVLQQISTQQSVRRDEDKAFLAHLARLLMPRERAPTSARLTVLFASDRLFSANPCDHYQYPISDQTGARARLILPN